MKKGLKIIVRIYRLIIFIFVYLIQLFMANLLIAKEIVSLHPKLKPGIIKLELDVKKDFEILSLVNLISMTPGSLCVDISEDKKYIYVHEMYLDNVEEMKLKIKNTLEKKILELSI